MSFFAIADRGRFWDLCHELNLRDTRAHATTSTVHERLNFPTGENASNMGLDYLPWLWPADRF